MGVVGTIIFPILKNRLGLPKTTMCGSVIQITFVSVSVASFFLPGSPWHMLSQNQDKGLSVGSSATTMAPNVGNLSVNASAGSDVGGEGMLNSGLDDNDDFNFTSVIVFAIGIIFSRAGQKNVALEFIEMKLIRSVRNWYLNKFSGFEGKFSFTQFDFYLCCFCLLNCLINSFQKVTHVLGMHSCIFSIHLISAIFLRLEEENWWGEEESFVRLKRSFPFEVSEGINNMIHYYLGN